jgi:hypothetical protein
MCHFQLKATTQLLQSAVNERVRAAAATTHYALSHLRPQFAAVPTSVWGHPAPYDAQLFIFFHCGPAGHTMPSLILSVPTTQLHPHDTIANALRCDAAKVMCMARCGVICRHSESGWHRSRMLLVALISCCVFSCHMSDAVLRSWSFVGPTSRA